MLLSQYAVCWTVKFSEADDGSGTVSIVSPVITRLEGVVQAKAALVRSRRSKPVDESLTPLAKVVSE